MLTRSLPFLPIISPRLMYFDRFDFTLPRTSLWNRWLSRSIFCPTGDPPTLGVRRRFKDRAVLAASRDEWFDGIYGVVIHEFGVVGNAAAVLRADDHVILKRHDVDRVVNLIDPTVPAANCERDERLPPLPRDDLIDL